MKEQDAFCPPCRNGYCQWCALHVGDADDPDFCRCDCDYAIEARERLTKNYHPAVPQEAKSHTDLVKLQDAMNRGSVVEIFDILFHSP